MPILFHVQQKHLYFFADVVVVVHCSACLLILQLRDMCNYHCHCKPCDNSRAPLATLRAVVFVKRGSKKCNTASCSVGAALHH